MDYILDFGDIKSDIPSTIIQVEGDNIIMIREGKIKQEELEKIAPLKHLED